MKKELTPEQKKLMIEVRDEWIGKLSTLKFDKDRAESGIDWLYSLINIQAPRKLHMNSPLSAQYGANMLKSLVDAKLI